MVTPCMPMIAVLRSFASRSSKQTFVKTAALLRIGVKVTFVLSHLHARSRHSRCERCGDRKKSNRGKRTLSEEEAAGQLASLTWPCFHHVLQIPRQILGASKTFFWLLQYFMHWPRNTKFPESSERGHRRRGLSILLLRWLNLCDLQHRPTLAHRT